MRSLLKALSQVVSAILVSPLVLLFYLAGGVTDKNALLSSFSQFLSILPGKSGVYLRSGFYRFALTCYAADVVVGFASLFSQCDIEIASGVYIGPQCNIGKCKIGKDSLLGSGVHIMSGKNQHNFDDINTPIREQGGIFEKVSIGKNCWIGNGALIMANVGDNCVVAAGSVVIKDIPEKSVVAGHPAKIIQTR